MGSAEDTQSRFCTNCGTALVGRFCSGCGTPSNAVAKSNAEGWGALTSEFLSSPKATGVLAVTFSFLRHPVRTILQLTDDPAYRSHWRFLTACVGAQLTLAFVILPRIYAKLFSLPDVTNSSAVITNEIVQYVGMAIMTPIQYYVCRAVGTIRRGPMSYVKLCVLSVSYGSLLSIATTLVFFTIVLADWKAGSVLELNEVSAALSLVMMAAVLVFVTLTHRRFWGMWWPVAIAVTLGAAAMSWLVVYPGLQEFVEQAKLGEMLGNLMSFTGR